MACSMYRPDNCLLVHGGILIDDLTFPDGRVINGVLGGAALHALAGAALWDDDVLLLGGVGRDADQSVLPWMHEAGLSTAGLRIAGEFTPRNIFCYRADGSRTETPAFGAEHFARLQPGPDELISRWHIARGAYVFHDADWSFWQPVLQSLREHSAPLLWEISADSCRPECSSDIARIAGRIAALSLNLQEAIGIFGNRPWKVLVEDIRSLGAGVAFLRCGADGSIAIWAQDSVAIPAYPACVVDVTGAGNAYGGAALAGLAQGADPVRAARMGALAARLTLGQHGLFAPRDALVRAGARAALSGPTT
jgi:sugar/nucleoside kinase (ribokinase family)